MDLISIDPGANGATCYLPERGDALFLDHKKATAAQLYQFMMQCTPELIVIEEVHSLYGMSAKSNFSFGYNLGAITTIAELVGAPIHRVQPKIWQKYIGCTKPSGKALKAEIGEIALNLYPNADIRGAKGGLLDGRSDALMIGHYGKHNIRTN